MKKLLFLAFALLFITGSAYALNETAENGPQNITSCWIKGTAAVTSGNIVILETNSPDYYGRQVTGCTTAGLPIYGVVVDTTNYSPNDLVGGKMIRVQTYGYCPIVKLAGQNAAVTASSTNGNLTEQSVLCTSDEVFKATSCKEATYAGVDTVSSATVALETKTISQTGAQATIKAWLGFF